MRSVLALVLFAFSFACTAFAQSQLGTGAISGTVQDTTGAVVPGVQITVTQAATELTRQIQSNETGQFLAPVLPTGVYRVAAAKPGFATVRQDVLVEVGGT